MFMSKSEMEAKGIILLELLLIENKATFERSCKNSVSMILSYVYEVQQFSWEILCCSDKDFCKIPDYFQLVSTNMFFLTSFLFLRVSSASCPWSEARRLQIKQHLIRQLRILRNVFCYPNYHTTGGDSPWITAKESQPEPCTTFAISEKLTQHYGE